MTKRSQAERNMLSELHNGTVNPKKLSWKEESPLDVLLLII